MSIEILKLLGGVFLLYIGAEGLVRGAKRIAVAFGIHPMIVGLTIVALGTSLPELFVSTTAGFKGSADIAIGNVVGSNIFNMSLILGIAAILNPMKVQDRTIRMEMPATIFAGILLYFFAGDLIISRWEGFVLVLTFVSYMLIAVLPHIIKRFKLFPQEIGILNVVLDGGVTPEEIAEARARKTWFNDSMFIFLGLAALVFGSTITVDSASTIARFLGISQLVIGASIVAAGTSLPELATSLVAAIKNEPDISIGNVIGSNFFNALIVAGVPPVLTGTMVMQKSVLIYDFPVMIALSFLALPLLRSGGKIDRTEGVMLIFVYIGYIALILIRPQFMPFLPLQ
jgi:cation:H+ antiporter